MNPALAQAMIDSWQAREDKQEERTAMNQLISFITTGCKKQGGGKYALADFLPDRLNKKHAEANDSAKEARLKNAFMAMAKQANING